MKFRRSLALVSALLVLSLLLQAQSGPPGGEVNDLLVVRTQPDLVFAATTGGVYRSTDGGRTWANRSAGLPAVTVNSIDGPSWMLYAAVGNQGVWRSVNGGVWNRTTDVFSGAEMLSVAVKPDDPLTVVASTSAGIYRSTDGGVTWASPGGPLPTSVAFAVEFSPLDPQVVAAAGNQIILRSTNGGASWTTNAANNYLFTRIAFDPNDAERIYFASNHGLFFLGPQGSSITFVNGLGDTSTTAIVVDPADSNRLLAFTGSLGVLRSTNRGQAWSSETTLPVGVSFALAAIPSEPGRFIAGMNGPGVFASTDGGANWAFSSTGLTAAAPKAVAISPTDSQTVWAALDSGGMLKSTDGGITWNESRSGYFHSGDTVLAVDPQEGNNLYAGSVDPSDPLFGLFSRSTDGGANWATSPMQRDVRTIAIDPSNGQNLLVGGSTGPFPGRFSYLWSTDGAATLSPDAGSLLSLYNVIDFTWDPSRSTDVWAIGYVNGGWSLWYSADSGVNFSELAVYTTPFLFLEIDPMDSDRIYIGTDGSGLARTTPGSTLAAANTGLPNDGAVTVNSLAIAPDAPQNLLIATDAGVFRSDNYGESWEASTAGLPAQTVRQVFAGDGVVYAATRGAGLYKSVDHGMTWSPSTKLPLDPAAIVHGANFWGGGLAPGQIASVFGSGFAGSVELAQAIPLPLELAGASVRVKDGAGSERAAALFFVSPGQINFEVPGDSVPGAGTLTAHFSDGSEATVAVQIVAVNPGIFASAGTGEGPAAAVAVRVAPDSTQTPVTVTTFSDGQHRTVPISVGGGQDPVVVLLFGSGIRGASTVEAFINGEPAPVVGFGKQSQFVGLDQVNVQIPDSLSGAGVVELYLVVDGLRTNSITLEIE